VTVSDLDDDEQVSLVKRPDEQVEPFVFDGELVDDEKTAPSRLQATAELLRVRPVITAIGGSSAAAATGRAARATARAGWVTGQGVVSGARRASAAVTHGHLREQVRLARLGGDTEAFAAAHDRLEKAKDARAKRLLGLPRLLLGVLYVAVAAVLLVVALLFLGGVAVQATPGGATWAGWWAGVGGVLTWTGSLLQVLVSVALIAAVPLAALIAWREGKRAADPPFWLMTSDERAQVGSEITADSITAALMHAKLQALTKQLKDGATLEFLVPPREQGGGTYFQVRLPLGVVAAELLPSKKVELLAGNLGRHMHEVWPQRQPDADARVLDCWVADKGTLDKPAPPWPLLHDGVFDVFRDRLPWGATMRGAQVSVGMLQKHWLIGATSKQGKSTALRVLALGLALDPTVELRISDLKGDGDWSMFAEIAQTLIEGQADEDAEATATMLEELVAEMARRYERKRELGIVGPIPRELSRRRGSGFHPIYAIVDECQILYAAPHPVGGTKDDARAWRAAKRLHDQARAVNIHLMQATQRPDNRTLPVQVREGAHVRAALNVPNHETAKLILADAADRGARPEDLRPGRDAGTVVATGEVEDIPAGMAFAIVRTHYVSTKEAHDVAARAVELRRRSGRAGTVAPAVEPEPIDHLADIKEALGDEPRVRTVVVLERLAARDPDTYEPWTAADLRAELLQHGVPVAKSDGQRVVRADDVHAALRARAEALP
jgi:S-DNA-T family DNA segregation ATPase FtsK/SpoIIIE